VAEPILSVRDLCVDYVSSDGPVRALDHASLDLMPGEVVGVAGESGCGKSTMAQAILRILPPPAVISGGQVIFEGRDLLAMDEGALRRIRWERIAMVFQSAMDALNPVLTVGEQIADTLRAHGAAPSGRAARVRAAELLGTVGIHPDRLSSYPHQLSGGMRQREILEEIQGLQRRRGFAVMFITHDLTRMLQFANRVAIFYAARLVEVAPAGELRTEARHPYTRGLLRAFPSVHGGDVELSSIPGSPPSLRNPPRGCRFHPRCAVAVDVCREREPDLVEIGPGHAAACHLVTG
jgi:peptide/nickel transport system ATP-binding protein